MQRTPSEAVLTIFPSQPLYSCTLADHIMRAPPGYTLLLRDAILGTAQLVRIPSGSPVYHIYLYLRLPLYTLCMSSGSSTTMSNQKTFSLPNSAIWFWATLGLLPSYRIKSLSGLISSEAVLLDMKHRRGTRIILPWAIAIVYMLATSGPWGSRV